MPLVRNTRYPLPRWQLAPRKVPPLMQVLGVRGWSGVISRIVGPTPASVASAAVKSTPMVSGGPATATVAMFLVLSVTTGTMITDAGANVVGFSGPPKVSRITAVVEKPSSAFTAAWLGSAAFTGWILSVPSVEPAKYRSFG